MSYLGPAKVNGETSDAVKVGPVYLFIDYLIILGSSPQVSATLFSNLWWVYDSLY